MLPMKPDLQELIISDGEFKKHTEVHETGVWGYLASFFIISFSLIVYFIVPVRVNFWIFMSYCIAFCYLIYGLSLLPEHLFIKRKFRTAFHIKKQVDNHNQIINNLHTLDQLAEIGNPVKINDRDAVIEALRITREGLVRALQTDRILRENPKFKPEYFNIDLSTLEAEKTTVKAIEYAQLLDDAVQIGVSVQKEMRKLQGKR